MWSADWGLRGTCLAVAAGTLAWAAWGAQAPPAPADQAALMQRKLAASQAILRGLALEDYECIATSADELLQIARQQWRAQETPEYRAQLKDFWTVLEGVKAAAENRNLDGATLAYVQMTISCIKCHKSLRKDLE